MRCAKKRSNWQKPLSNYALQAVNNCGKCREVHFPAGGDRRLVGSPLEGKGISRLNESMASRESAFIDITPEVLLKAYSCGIFPMAESADDPALYWIEPESRGIIPLDRFHLAARLARTVRATPFTVVVDRNFDAVIEGCAQPQPGRSRTWINSRIRTLYRKLYERGDCHTVEVYDGESLVGGLYGVSLGRAFFGESMFHRARDASKIALVHLVARLKAGGYRLLDTQFVTEHLRSFGATEVSRPVYHKLLDAALVGEADFTALPVDHPISGETILAGLARS
jgi:leucyl/phenylalanyl-tRNA--protein transferase